MTTSTQQSAREAAISIWHKHCWPFAVKLGLHPPSVVIDAMLEFAALASTAAPDDVQKTIRSLEQSVTFYRFRCELLQQWQGRMRDPERTIVCDILANGQTLPDANGSRYGPGSTAAPEPTSVRVDTVPPAFRGVADMVPRLYDEQRAAPVAAQQVEPLTDAEVIERATAAGLKWLDPMPGIDDGDRGFPGGFDLCSIEDVRRLVAASPRPTEAVNQRSTDDATLNKLIDLGARAAHEHAKSNSDDGHAGTEAYVKWHALREEMRAMLSAAPPAPAATRDGARLPLTGEQVNEGRLAWLHGPADEHPSGFWAGVRFAEAHHGIGGTTEGGQ